jgi:uncharacterized protein (TIGR02117 family)
MSRRIFALLVALFWTCAMPPQTLQEDPSASERVLVVHDNWHSALVLSAADLRAADLPEIRDFPDADYIEFSWGDREYFPHPDPGAGLMLKAAFCSAGSILHVVGVRREPASYYSNSDIIAIALRREQLEALIDFISATFARRAQGSAGEAQPGLSENARFYAANGTFSILRTCNTWVAEALQAAGLPIEPKWVVTARILGRKARPLGITVQEAAGK